jgi:hypothetical protein
LDLLIFEDIPNTKEAIIAARITVIATIRITPIMGDTASSFFFEYIHNTSM